MKLEGVSARVYAGRDPSACQLAHADQTLSRRHAEIWLDHGNAYLRDLGSANGTWVNGAHLGHEAVALQPGMQIWLGHVPLGVTWAIDGGQTAMAQEMPPELKALVAARQQQQQTAAATPLAAPQSTSTPLPSEFAYRKQGANSNGVMLLALRQDTFFNGTEIEGYVEFTSQDNQTVASITVELVELKRGGVAEGHTWDRFLVRQGPWRAAHGDILPLPFRLRVPPGTVMSGPDIYWEIRGLVDINWAVDIHANIGIQMRNQDMERIRDALGAMDYRVGEIKAVARGQRFEAQFYPPANLARDWGVNEIELALEYLGANLKVHMKLDRKGLHHDPMLDQVFEIGRLRAASQAELNATFKAMLDQLMPKK